MELKSFIYEGGLINELVILLVGRRKYLDKFVIKAFKKLENGSPTYNHG